MKGGDTDVLSPQMHTPDNQVLSKQKGMVP